jgi:hypothetical protein
MNMTIIMEILVIFMKEPLNWLSVPLRFLRITGKNNIM